MVQDVGTCHTTPNLNPNLNPIPNPITIICQLRMVQDVGTCYTTDGRSVVESSRGIHINTVKHHIIPLYVNQSNAILSPNLIRWFKYWWNAVQTFI